MNQEDIISMAREAGFATSWTEAAGKALERFAAFVADEKEKQIINILERLQERNESHNYYKYAINVIKGEI